MKIEQLTYFVETAKQEHIGRASKILGISPSAISHSIRALEGELGVDLFNKKGKYIVLSREGQKLLDKAQDLIAQFQNLRSELLKESDEASYYRIGASHTLSSFVVTPVWAELSQEYLRTKVDLLTLRSSDVLKGVLSKELDLGVAFSPLSHPDLISTELYRGQLYLVVRDKHPILKEKVDRRLELLSEYKAVLPKAFEGVDVCIQNPMFDKYGVVPNAMTLTDSYDIALELIANSNYWGFIPDYILNSLGPGFKIIVPKSGWSAEYNISVLWRKGRFTPKFFNDFKEGLEKKL